MMMNIVRNGKNNISVNHTTGSIVSLRKCLSRCCVIFSTLKAHSQASDNFFATESPLKMMKNVYSILKAPFVLKKFKFVS